ncbi:MAG: hypothetical protein LBN07_03405 [Christensenellaceae bacterium]|jgi:hypothetical protein|nr:hypothetical protein [Christensenellaceae bacterium]
MLYGNMDKNDKTINSTEILEGLKNEQIMKFAKKAFPWLSKEEDLGVNRIGGEILISWRTNGEAAYGYATPAYYWITLHDYYYLISPQHSENRFDIFGEENLYYIETLMSCLNEDTLIKYKQRTQEMLKTLANKERTSLEENVDRAEEIHDAAWQGVIDARTALSEFEEGSFMKNCFGGLFEKLIDQNQNISRQ